MKWTESAPTELGWYWVLTSNHQLNCVELIIYSSQLSIDGYSLTEWVEEYGPCKWYGPIQPPDDVSTKCENREDV